MRSSLGILVSMRLIKSSIESRLSSEAMTAAHMLIKDGIAFDS